MISVGFVVATTLAALLLVAGAVGILFGIRGARKDGWDGLSGWWFAVAGGVISLIITVIITVSLYPYDMQYHRWKPVNGAVAEVRGRLLGNGESTSQNYAVRFVEDPTIY